jgi:hypothetical protein
VDLHVHALEHLDGPEALADVTQLDESCHGCLSSSSTGGMTMGARDVRAPIITARKASG